MINNDRILVLKACSISLSTLITGAILIAFVKQQALDQKLKATLEHRRDIYQTLYHYLVIKRKNRFPDKSYSVIFA